MKIVKISFMLNIKFSREQILYRNPFQLLIPNLRRRILDQPFLRLLPALPPGAPVQGDRLPPQIITAANFLPTGKIPPLQPPALPPFPRLPLPPNPQPSHRDSAPPIPPVPFSPPLPLPSFSFVPFCLVPGW